MSKMLYSVNWKGEKPTLAQVAKKFGFDRKDVDEDFGVVEIDPQDSLYSILVEETAIASKDKKNIEGPFSNPRIEPFGLEE
ncbi:MAG: hypothetical protein ACKVRN_01345 [Pyrinomonadaceae bacterium]